MRRRVALLTALTCTASMMAIGCHRAEQGVFINAPFNEETRIATVEAQWQPTAAAGEGETLHFEVRVSNKLADRLFVRLGNFTLTDAGGAVLAHVADERSCVLPASGAAIVLSGEVAVPRGAAARVAEFAVDRFGVPLSPRGRSIYREFLLQEERASEAQIDADMAAYMQSPPCS